MMREGCSCGGVNQPTVGWTSKQRKKEREKQECGERREVESVVCFAIWGLLLVVLYDGRCKKL